MAKLPSANTLKSVPPLSNHIILWSGARLLGSQSQICCLIAVQFRAGHYLSVPLFFICKMDMTVPSIL